jgi:hypothetical protein
LQPVLRSATFRVVFCNMVWLRFATWASTVMLRFATHTKTVITLNDFTLMDLSLINFYLEL